MRDMSVMQNRAFNWGTIESKVASFATFSGNIFISMSRNDCRRGRGNENTSATVSLRTIIQKDLYFSMDTQRKLETYNCRHKIRDIICLHNVSLLFFDSWCKGVNLNCHLHYLIDYYKKMRQHHAYMAQRNEIDNTVKLI